MKRILCCVLCLALAFGLMACSSNTTGVTGILEVSPDFLRE